ncbi:MAG: T9SS type A sorting domain-containing protein [Rhizobacter sp.]|nr:T9SS type A sorting domain-containing protein [Chlorobiales bacterium]
MKRTSSLLIALLLLAVIPAQAQDDASPTYNKINGPYPSDGSFQGIGYVRPVLQTPAARRTGTYTIKTIVQQNNSSATFNKINDSFCTGGTYTHSYAIQQFKVATSVDGTSWQTVATLASFPIGAGTYIADITLSQAAYILVYATESDFPNGCIIFPAVSTSGNNIFSASSDGPPSPPTIGVLKVRDGDHPMLKWTNAPVDAGLAGNKIYRIIRGTIADRSEYSLIKTINDAAVTSFTDSTVTMTAYGASSIDAYYKIKSFDNVASPQHLSVFSDSVSWDIYTQPSFLVAEQMPEQHNLTQNYPNPFNPSTTISYQVPTNEVVKLKVYDVFGREVATLVNESKPAGFYSVVFDASKLSSGTYFYRLTAGNYTQTKRMLLVK